MGLKPGTRLGPYEIEAPLGAGGMGEVVRARDTQLDRLVAIKSLPETFARDAERVARLEREAKVLASLSHPHIGGIHGLIEDDGRRYLVLEFVDGETLAQRLSRGALPLDDAIALARQMAAALEVAHERGVVHRDLKPSNIVLQPNGDLKILDFGLAKAVAGDAAHSADNFTHSPTMSVPLTASGILLGTAAYMSPEQARGKPAGPGADVWAFGVVLWEMLCGQRLFTGETTSDVLAAVLRGDPDWDAMPPTTPTAVRRLLRRCLERDPRRRLHAMGDVRLELDEAIDELAGKPAPETSSIGDAAWSAGVARPGLALPPHGGSTARTIATWAILLALAVVPFAIGRWLLPARSRTATASPIHTSIALPEGVRLGGWASPVMAFSPDGSKLAYVGVTDTTPRRLYVYDLPTGETTLAPESDEAEGPFFSPDGEWVAFAVGVSLASGIQGEMKKYSLRTGLTQSLCNIRDYFGGQWLADGSIVYSGVQPNGLRRIVDGVVQDLVPLFRHEGQEEQVLVAWPQVLDDGRTVLFTDWSHSPSQAALVDIETRELTHLGFSATYVRLLPTGHLVFTTREANLMAAPFDRTRRKLKGEPVAVLKDITLGGGDAAVLASALDGHLAYTTGYLHQSGRELLRLVRIGPHGTMEPLPLEPKPFGRVANLSPDGRRLVVAQLDGLWSYDLTRGTAIRLPTQDPDVEFPIWTPDGQSVIYTNFSRGALFRIAADGSASPRTFLETNDEKVPGSVTPDGEMVLFDNLRGNGMDIYKVPLAGGEPEVVVQTTGDDIRPALSPDGRWLAYVSTITGRLEVYVVPFGRAGPATLVSVGGGNLPRWSREGRVLYYSNGDDIWHVPVSTADAFHPGTPQRFATVPDMRSFGTGMNSDELIALQRLPGSGYQTQIHFVLNWFDQLNRLVPGSQIE